MRRRYHFTNILKLHQTKNLRALKIFDASHGFIVANTIVLTAFKFLDNENVFLAYPFQEIIFSRKTTIIIIIMDRYLK